MSTQIQISPPSALVVGTTAVTSGTVGRVFFQGTGDVVQQSSSLFWDNTNSRLGVGATPATNARLDVRAQGALSTDIALRVRNSADSANLMTIQGDNKVVIDAATTFVANGINILNNSFNRLEHTVTLVWSGGGSSLGYACSSTQDLVTGSIGGSPIYGKINWHDQNVQIGSNQALNGRGVFSVGTNTAPTTNMTDGFRMYSADITAGNAAPHFRTENGSIVKLYQNAAVTTPQGLADALTNLGLLAASTIVNSIPTHDGPTYDTNAIQTLTAAEYAAIGTPNASTLYFIV